MSRVLHSLCASAQSRHSQKRIVMRMIEHLHFAFAPILPGQAQGA
jgi:hypothetical protein